MKKNIILTTLLTLMAMEGSAQVRWRLEGNIGNPEITDTLTLYEERCKETNGRIFAKVLDTLYIVKGKIVPIEGELSEPMLANAYSKKTTLLHFILGNGTTHINGTIGDMVVRQSGIPLADAMNKMEEDFYQLSTGIGQTLESGAPIDTAALIARLDSFAVIGVFVQLAGALAGSMAGFLTAPKARRSSAASKATGGSSDSSQSASERLREIGSHGAEDILPDVTAHCRPPDL